MELVVTGSCSIGTALITGLLNGAGVSMGDVEDPAVVSIHTGILTDNGVEVIPTTVQAWYIRDSRWGELSRFVTQRQSQHADWGFADPRACYFLGVWRYLLPDARFIITYRDPEEHGGGVDAWSAYYRHAVAFARAHLDDCLVLPGQRLSSAFPFISAVNTRFGTSLVATAAHPDPSAGSRSGRRSEDATGTTPGTAQLWRSLEELATRTGVDP